MVTEDGTRTVTEVTQLVRKVADLFNNLASLAGSVNENAQQMMLNTKQQSAAFAQVVQATTASPPVPRIPSPGSARPRSECRT